MFWVFLGSGLIDFMVHDSRFGPDEKKIAPIRFSGHLPDAIQSMVRTARSLPVSAGGQNQSRLVAPPNHPSTLSIRQPPLPVRRTLWTDDDDGVGDVARNDDPLRVAAPIRRVRSTPRVSATAPHAFVDGHVSGSVAPPASVVALRRRAAAGAAAVAVALSAHALPADAKLVNVSIDQASLTSRVCDDPRAGGVPGTATYKAKCMEILGVAVNPSSETVYNADVYGQVKDNANDDVLNSGRVGSIAKLAPGPNDFRLQLTVANSQPLPLKLKAFKAQGVTTQLNASPNPYDDYTDFDDFGAQK